MARQKGIIKIDGTIGGITFYEMGGDYLAKKANGPDRDAIYREEKYARLRENMQEFGGASTIGKTFRTVLRPFLPIMGDPSITGRLTALFKKIIVLGDGKRGERDFTLSSYGKMITGFEFSRNYKFDSFCRAKCLPLKISADRNVVECIYPKFDARNGISSPKGATHFQLVFVSVLLSDFIYIPEVKRYVPVEPDLHAKTAYVFSDVYGKNEKIQNGIVLSGDFKTGVEIPSSVAIVTLTGILFYQEVNEDYYEFSEGNALKIDQVRCQ